MSAEDISNIRKYSTTRSQVRNLIKEFNLSRNLSVPTETLDYLRQQVDFDGLIEVTDDHGSFAGSKPLRRGYFLTFEPDFEKLALWHKLNAPFSLSIDSSYFQRNGTMHGIPLPVKSYDNGLIGSVQLATGFDGLDDWVDIPDIPQINMYRVLEGFTFHIKFAPCTIDLSNGMPVTLYAKRDPLSPKGYGNSIISVLLPDGSVATKLTFNGFEYTAKATNFFDPQTTEFGVQKWYDHTVRFSSISRELDLLIDNVQYNDQWTDANLTPYPTHDTDWHIGRSTFTNRGLFWGGLGDFRYYWDLFFRNQHSYNLFANRISISNIPYGQAAVVGHSYVTHSADIGQVGGFEPPLDDGRGFIAAGMHFLFKAEPISNDLIPVYRIITYPKTENDLMLAYNINYNPPVANNLPIIYDIRSSVYYDESVYQDLLFQYDIGGTINPPPGGTFVCPIGWSYDSIQDRCVPPTGGGGGGGGGTDPPPVQPVLKIGAVSDWDGDTMQTNCDNMKAHGVTQVIIPGDFNHDDDLGPSMDALDSMGSAVAGCNAMEAVGNHSDPDEDGNSTMWSQEKSYFCHTELGDNILVKSKQVLNVYMISLCSQDTNMDSTSSPQYAWFQNELAKATALKAQGKVHWIFVLVHKPFIAMPTDHPIDEMGAASLYVPLMQQAGVDFVFSGHNHVLQYSKPLTSSSQVSGVQLASGVWDFTKPHGIFFFEVATGGRSSDNNSGLSASYQYANDSDYGFTLLTLAADGLNLTIQFWSEDDEMLYEFKVTKSGGGTGGGGGGGTTPTGQAFKFNIAGDFRSGQDAEDTAANLVSDDPDVMLFLGDYAVGDASETEWCTQIMAPVYNSGTPVWGCNGNHDNDNYLDVGFFENTSWVWSVKYGNIMFISADTVAESVSATQTLVQAAQQNPAIMRIVILMHESVFKQAGGGTDGADATLAYHTMFKQNSKIKLVIAGHSHNWTVFPEYEGIVYVINEDGGQQPDADTGCMHCTSDSSGKITCNMIPNGGSSIGSFTIPATTGGGGGSDPPVGDPVCPSGYTLNPTNFKCMSNTVTCPVGQHWDSAQNRCVVSPQSCPVGQHWDSALARCVSDSIPGGGTGVIDAATGIEWKVARGQIGPVISQSRDDAGDFRWSEVFSGLDVGYEATAYFTFSGVDSGGHWALKMWGGNHCGSCQYEEDGECCCWYDLGIRSGGDVQLEIERPHPSNDSFSVPSGGTNPITDIGVEMDGSTIGLKWLVHPVTPGGSVDNGGVRVAMWVDTDGLSGNRPQNHWRLVVDFVDNGEVLDGMPTLDEQEIESRNSDTDSTDQYMGGIHWRRYS